MLIDLLIQKIILVYIEIFLLDITNKIVFPNKIGTIEGVYEVQVVLYLEVDSRYWYIE